MKKFNLFSIILVLSFMFSGCDKGEPLYLAGTYLGQSEGYYSKVTVCVVVDDYQIMDIEIVSHEEPEILSKIVFKELPPRIIKKNSTDVDVISGATYTSLSLLDAVEKALTSARQ